MTAKDFIVVVVGEIREGKSKRMLKRARRMGTREEVGVEVGKVGNVV
jgi:hypothetical protein